MIRYLLFAPFLLVIAVTAIAVNTQDAYVAGCLGCFGVWAFMYGIVNRREQ